MGKGDSVVAMLVGQLCKVCQDRGFVDDGILIDLDSAGGSLNRLL